MVTKLIGLYVIIEPAVRNMLTVGAGVAAIGHGMLLVGAALIVWALVDTVIKSTAGALVIKHRAKTSRDAPHKYAG